MCFLAISFLVKVVSLTNLDGISAINPETIQNTLKERLSLELELDTEIITNMATLNNYRDFSLYNEDLIKTFKSSFIYNNQQRNLIKKVMENEENEDNLKQLSQILGNIIKHNAVIRRNIKKIENKIKSEEDTKNNLLLKILQNLELNKIQNTALPSSCKKTVVDIQEFLLFIVETIVDEDIILYIQYGLLHPEDIPNEFIRNFLKSSEDIALLQEIQTILIKIILNKSNYDDLLTEIQQKLGNLLLRLNVNVLNAELLNQEMFVNNTIRSDNPIRAALESKFIERYQKTEVNQFIVVIPLKFILKDGIEEDTITIKVPMFLMEIYDEILNNHIGESEN